MRLNYYILWVEDDNSWFDTTSKMFIDTIVEYGFTPIIERRIGVDDVVKLVDETGLKKIDVCLIDFNLKNSTGDDIIEILRSKDIYTDIIFYSSDKHSIIESIKEHQFEGVYHSDRNDIESKFEKVFKTTIKKVEEVNSMRGLIVGETSELDALIETNLNRYIYSPFIKEFDVDSFFEKEVFQKSKNRTDFLKECYNKGLGEVLNHIDAIKKWELLRGILKANKDKPDITQFLTVNSSYQKEVIEIRNKFAHCQVGVSSDGSDVLKSFKGDIEFNENSFKKVRENLIKHRDSFKLLK